MLPRLKRLLDRGFGIIDRAVGMDQPPVLMKTDPNDHEAQRIIFMKHFPRAVWDERRGGFTDPKYTYALAGWIMHLEHCLGILDPRDLYHGHGPVEVPPSKECEYD